MSIYKAGCLVISLVLLAVILYSVCTKKYKEKTGLFISLIVLLGAIFVYHSFLFGNTSFFYATSDGNASYLPRFMEIIRNLRNGWSWWSFSIGLGASVPINSPISFNPLNIPPVLAGYLYGEKAMAVTLAWMQVFKMGLAAFFMYHFLIELGIKKNGAAYGGIVYAFSGVIILRGFWLFFADECYLAALLFYIVELLYKKNKWIWTVITVMLIGLSLGVYYLYLYGLILVIYITARYFLDGNDKKQFIKYILKCAGIYLLGIGLSAVYSIGIDLASMLNTARADNGTAAAAGSLITNWKVVLSALMSFYGTDTMGTFDQYSGILNYLERPLFYIGVGSILFSTIALKNAGSKKRKAYVLFLALAAAYLLLPFVTDVFNLFISNVELGARAYRLSSLWIVIGLVVISSDGFESFIERKYSEKLYTAAGILSVLLLLALSWLCAHHTEAVIDKKMVCFSILMCIVWVILPFFLNWNKKHILAQILCIGLVFMEMIYSDRNTISGAVTYATGYYGLMQADPLGYYGEVNNIVSYLKQTDSGFYRIGGIRITAGNARYSNPMYFGYDDSSYYTNIDSSTYQFMSHFASESFDTNEGSKYSLGTGGISETAEITAYKYFVTVQGAGAELPQGYQKVKEFGSLVLYQNEVPLSIGIAYDSYVLEQDLEKYSEDERRKLLMHAAVLDTDSKDLEKLSDSEIAEIAVDDSSDSLSAAKKLQQNGFELDRFKPDHITGKITVQRTEQLVFSIPDVKGWSLIVDGHKVPVQQCDYGLISTKLESGEHQIELIYRMPLLKYGAGISVVSLVLLGIMLRIAHQKKNAEEDQQRR